ncbi:MAG: hypothetical protein K2X93_13690 [Candidatus Obscuribacterales bacterium]|nr:hypothetical protein [Candidatus Obscuribacterales bacterium]
MIEDRLIESIEQFEILPLSSQLDHLATEIKREVAPVELIALCRPLRDPAPLAWLSRQLLENSWLSDDANRLWFAEFLVKLPDSSVDKILKALAQSPLDDALGTSYSALLLAALRIVPLSELSTMCLLDRSAKNFCPDSRDQHLNELYTQVQDLLKSGSVCDIPPRTLAQLPGNSISNLEQLAQSISTQCYEDLRKVKAELAESAIEVLSNAPKAVSQANAEDLLARRVYTDPGHFLIELLQNAEDAGAKQWKVIFESDKVIVWHDGAVFDTRDLVGITSIGQTTKRKQQIGFFGVGFKSVYEVTDRPQVYSDVYCFEIADVSIPKLLGHRPPFVPPDGTAVVLPLRKSLDAARSPLALYEQCVALDSCVLLTLRSIELIEFQLNDAKNGSKRHALIECADQKGWSIRYEPSEQVVSYLIQDDTYTYDGHAREAGRPDSTKIMVGILLDDDGQPIRLPATAAEVYSYLPTRENPGLRFFIQGHFDVPVDRERITPESHWNRWIISQVPNQLRRIALRFSEEEDQTKAARLLDVLPLLQDLPNAPFSLIPEHLHQTLSDIRMVPSVHNSLVAPVDSLVAPPSILELFDEERVDDRRAFVSNDVSDRAKQIILELGGTSFDTKCLLDFLIVRLSAQSFHPPVFLKSTAKLELLYDLLLTELEALERSKHTDLLSSRIKLLESLPIIMDSNGTLRRPTEVVRGSEDLRNIYGSEKIFVDHRLDSAGPRTIAFLNWLEIKQLDFEYLVEDLEKNLSDRQLPIVFPCDIFPYDFDRLNLILKALAEADWRLLKRVGRLPLFQASDNTFWPVATSISDLTAVVDGFGNELSIDLAEFYGNARPIAVKGQSLTLDSGDQSSKYDQLAAAALMNRLGAPSLSLSTLADDLNGTLNPDMTGLRKLHVLLERYVEEISEKISKQLVGLNIWPDRHGRLLSLTGKNRVYIAADDAIEGVFDKAPFLDKEISGRLHIIRMQIAPVSVSHVINGLCLDAEPPLSIDNVQKKIELALNYILSKFDLVDSTGIRALREKAVFLSDEGVSVPLANLALAESDELRALYGSSPLRHFISRQGTSLAIAQKLGLDNLLLRADAEILAGDLEIDLKGEERRFVFENSSTKPLIHYISRRVDTMTRPLLQRFARLEIYPDTTGSVGALPIDPSDNGPDFVYPCPPYFRAVASCAGLRLLQPDLETTIRPFLIAAKIPEAGLTHLVEALERGKITNEEDLSRIQEVFVDRKRELQDLFPPAYRADSPNQVLNRLKIWKTLNGEITGASNVMGGNLSQLFEKGTAEQKDLEKVCVSAPALERLQALSPVMIPLAPESYLSDLIERTAKANRPLTDQPFFLGSIERIIRLYEVVGNRNKIKLPTVDALSRLSFDKLFYTDSATMSLVSGLPICEQLLHADLCVYFELGNKEPSRLVNFRNQLSKMWNKMVSTRGFEDFESLAPHMVIAALDGKIEADRRNQFYRWLLANKALIFDDKTALAKLSEASLFLTRKGRMVRACDLVFEDDFPDLGIDWFPSSDIPKQLLETLSLHLDIKRPNLDELIVKHIVPAYEAATESGDKEQAGKLLIWLAKRLDDRSEFDVRKLLRTKSSNIVKLESSDGTFVTPSDLILAPSELREHYVTIWGGNLVQPSELRYPPEVHPFLQSMGVRTSPSIKTISVGLESVTDKNKSIAFAHLISYLANTRTVNIFNEFPKLRTTSWLLNQSGEVMMPVNLYVRTFEVESLIGPFLSKYLDRQQEEILGPALCKELNFRQVEQIQADDVMKHIQYRAERKEIVSASTYAWLDCAIDANSLSGKDLEKFFGSTPWILTDDGEYETHHKIMGSREFHLFGNLRGYWTRGWKEHPSLCRALEISAEPSAKIVKAFIEEIGLEVQEKGAQQLLQREHALPMMMINCFAIMSRRQITISNSLPVIPAISRGASDLVPAMAPGLYWSDTPTLETLFQNVGKLYLAKRAAGEFAEDVDQFYNSMGIRRLRDTYKIVAAKKEGDDRSQDNADSVLSLRGILRALLAVIPRIEVERELAPDTTWVYSKHLRSLAASGSIRAIEHLKVRYVLPGVGETEVDRPAVYNAERGELLIDTEVVADPELTGLAEGLLPSIIEGPSAETFVDLFEILLARKTTDDMTAYLNRRHFAAAQLTLGTADQICQRIGELLDYGLTQKIAKRHSVLLNHDLSSWRSPSILKRIEDLSTKDLDATASGTVPILLDAIGVVGDHAELNALLKKLLIAPSVSACSELLVESKAIEPTISGDIKDSFQKEKTESEKPTTNVVELYPTQKEKTPEQPKKGFLDFLFGRSASKDESSGLARIAPKEENKEARSVSDPNLRDPLPEWLLGNYFAPSKVIPSQIWYSQENLVNVSALKKKARMHFSPGRLPAPHLYAVQKVGINFNPVLQNWTFGRSAGALFQTQGRPSGRIVSFSGSLFAGKSRLPIPLYSHLSGGVIVGDGILKGISFDEFGPIVDLAGSGAISVSYEVEIQELPSLSDNNGPKPPLDKALTTPTVKLPQLPNALVEWITQTLDNPVSDWSKALAAQEFVRSHYQYDGAFTELSSVKDRRAKLSFLSGNHHLEILHASYDDRVLGRGVCYELNVLLVEILRHLKIPSCIAIGWVLDEGVIDLADHLFALALVTSSDGSCIMPLDAAATDRGPIHTVPRRNFPSAPLALHNRPSIPQVKGAWNITPRNPSTTRSATTEKNVRAHETGDSEDAMPSSGFWDGQGNRPQKKVPEQKLHQITPLDKLLGRKSEEEKTNNLVSTSAAQARLAEETRLRMKLETMLAEEKKLRYQAETRFGEERRLRKAAEDQLNHGSSPKKGKSTSRSEQEQEQEKNSDYIIEEPKRQAEEFRLLNLAYRRVTASMGLDPEGTPMGTEMLRRKLITFLGNERTLNCYLGLMRGKQNMITVLTEELRTLEDLRLIEIEEVPSVMVHTVDLEDEE